MVGPTVWIVFLSNNGYKISRIRLSKETILASYVVYAGGDEDRTDITYREV